MHLSSTAIPFVQQSACQTAAALEAAVMEVAVVELAVKLSFGLVV